MHPSAATTRNLFEEAQILAKIQAAMTVAENENSTLHFLTLFDENIGTAERLFDSIKKLLGKN